MECQVKFLTNFSNKSSSRLFAFGLFVVDCATMYSLLNTVLPDWKLLPRSMLVLIISLVLVVKTRPDMTIITNER
jgi:hypothetical protein